MRLSARILKKKIVIIGSGSGGLSTAARLARGNEYDISIIDSSKTHYYQEMVWT